MKTIRFTYDPRMGYRCSEPGNQDGEYVPLSEAVEMARNSQRQHDDLERKYEEVMSALRDCMGQHGDCKSGKRYGGVPMACTACMAELKLVELGAAWRGRKVRLV